MSFRITNRNGKTIGYARDQSLDLLGVLIVGVVVIVMGIIILPIYVVVVGVQTVLPWYLMFWDWASNLPLTPFPNLNGLIVVAVIGLAGGLLHQYVPLHSLLFYMIGNLFRFVALDIFLGMVKLIVVFVTSGLIMGLVFVLPIFFLTWLFTKTGEPLFSGSVFSPFLTFVWGIDLSAIDFLFEYTWIISLVFPLIFPLSWVCGWIIVKVAHKYQKTNRIKFNDDYFLPEEGIKRLYTVIASWLGMFLLHANMSGVELFVFGTLLGVIIWGGARGTYRLISGKADGSVEDYMNVPAPNMNR